jgi:hypothetical protein
MNDDTPITMALTDNGGVYTRWPCSFCGGCTEKVPILCEAPGLRACECCLMAGQDALAAAMGKNAEEHEAEAARLRSLIGRVKIPTYAEWEEAERKHHENVLALREEAAAREDAARLEYEARRVATDIYWESPEGQAAVAEAKRRIAANDVPPRADSYAIDDNIPF